MPEIEVPTKHLRGTLHEHARDAGGFARVRRRSPSTGKRRRRSNWWHVPARRPRSHLAQHDVLARSVTLFQAAIALAAIAVLTPRKPLFSASLAFSAGGLFFFVQGPVT